MGASYISLKEHKLMIFFPASETFPAIPNSYDWINKPFGYMAIQICQHLMVEAIRQQRGTWLLTALKLSFLKIIFLKNLSLLFLSEIGLIPSIF